MSKKYKRQANKQAVSNTATNVPTTSAVPAARTTSTSQSNFNPDYAYVTKDLRRIGVLAGTFISILVILTFFLR